MTTNAELFRLDQLERDACRFAAHLYAVTLREPLDSPRLLQLKRAAETANRRADRRYNAAKAAYRSCPDYV